MNRTPYSVSMLIDSAIWELSTSIVTPSSAGYNARKYSGAYTGTPATSPTCSASGPGQKSSYKNGAVDSQHPVPIVNTSAPRRSVFARSTRRAAASVPRTITRPRLSPHIPHGSCGPRSAIRRRRPQERAGSSDVAAQRGEVQVTAAVGRRVLPDVLDLAVLVEAVVTE